MPVADGYADIGAVTPDHMTVEGGTFCDVDQGKIGRQGLLAGDHQQGTLGVNVADRAVDGDFGVGPVADAAQQQRVGGDWRYGRSRRSWRYPCRPYRPAILSGGFTGETAGDL